MPKVLLLDAQERVKGVIGLRIVEIVGGVRRVKSEESVRSGRERERIVRRESERRENERVRRE